MGSAGAAPVAPGSGNEGMGGGLPLQPGQGNAEPATLSRVLVFTRTLSYRHDSIGPGINAVRQLGTENGFSVDASEDAATFADAALGDYDVVIFLSTTADVLNDEQQAALQRYVQGGGGWVGIHAASDTEYDWPWYGQLLGNDAWFRIHPAIQTAQLDVEQAEHASTEHLPARFSLQDEWYNFRANPRSSVTVLLRLDESSYLPGEGAMGSDHPISWYHEFDGGRAWYTAIGHRSELYSDPLYTQHLLGGIRWAAGVAP
jgi:cytochrome c